MKFALDPLPYPKSALAPHISAETLEFHYEKHHKGYLQKLEKAIGNGPMADLPLEEIVRTSEGSVFNNAAQVWNHAFYWKCMSPKGGGQPRGDLLRAIERGFGSFGDFRARFMKVANAEFGSGWAWLGRSDTGELKVYATDDAENPLICDDTPLLTIDLWEHAYYIDYRNQRERYVETFIDHLVAWDFVAANSSRPHAPLRRSA